MTSSLWATSSPAGAIGSRSPPELIARIPGQGSLRWEGLVWLVVQSAKKIHHGREVMAAGTSWSVLVGVSATGPHLCRQGNGARQGGGAEPDREKGRSQTGRRGGARQGGGVELLSSKCTLQPYPPVRPEVKMFHNLPKQPCQPGEVAWTCDFSYLGGRCNRVKACLGLVRPYLKLK